MNEQEVRHTFLSVMLENDMIVLFYNRAGMPVTDNDALCKMTLTTAEQFAAALAEAIAQAKALESEEIT